MTLNEYITQSEPQANVKVILKEGEYIQRNAIKVTPFGSDDRRYSGGYTAVRYKRQLYPNRNRPAVVCTTSPNGRTARKRVFPARRCPGTARTFSIHAIPKGGYGILRTMGKREPATGGFAGT